ncbi:MAG: outer membrane lipoprotein-sorting protein [Limnochordia bacterium]|jgi:outer membrane lipoprotein-sorting protein|nr:outer membrane lipoprotein-sorting protein [Bacillota bacterium]
MQKAVTAILLLLVLFFPAGATELTADEVLDRVEGEMAFTGDGTAVIELITVNPKGVQRKHELKVWRKEDPDETSKQLLEYLSPPDVKGTKFLSITPPEGESSMWLYLPALGRERRIAGHTTKDTFMGTDFTYEEIGGSRDFTKEYKAKRLPDETFDGYPCYVLELSPDADGAEYGLVKMWVWQDEFLPLQIQFFNKGLEQSKVLINRNIKEAAGRLTPHAITMENTLKKTKTIINLLAVEEVELPDDLFSLRQLRR